MYIKHCAFALDEHASTHAQESEMGDDYNILRGGGYGQIEADESEVNVIPYAQHVASYFQSAREREHRKTMSSTSPYPVHQTADLDILQNEFLMARCKPLHGVHETSEYQGNPVVPVFTSFNGMNPQNPEDDWYFVGQAKTNANPNPNSGSSMRGPNMVTSIMTGHLTATNMGDDSIQPHDTIILAWSDSTSMNRMVVPKVGIPSKYTKFLPAVRRYSFKDAVDTFDAIEDDFFAVLFTASGKGDEPSDESARVQLGPDEAQNMADTTKNLPVGERGDLITKVKAAFPYHLYSLFPRVGLTPSESGWTVAEAEDVCPVRKVVNLLLACLFPDDIPSTDYTFQASQALREHERAVQNPIFPSFSASDDTGSDDMSGAESKRQPSSSVLNIKPTLFTVSKLSRSLLKRQHEIVSKKVIGTSLTPAAPGKRFEFLMRYHS